ncbi:MAG: hypothetical protein ACRYF0_09380 [Janthinobacterium lividum]
MELRKKMGIYEFTKETKRWPDWERDGKSALLDSHYHYFVIMDIHDEYYEGFMFSTKPYPNNVLLRSEHFEAGGFPFKPSYFLTVPLKKFHHLKTNPEPVGWLSQIGKAYIEAHAKGPTQTWDDYVKGFLEST